MTGPPRVGWVALACVLAARMAFGDPAAGGSAGGLGFAGGRQAAAAVGGTERAIPIVLPDPTHMKLAIQPEGVAALSALTGPVATIVVIGPFRSGKSFVLNQILGLPCDRGFSVGHERHAQTKGIWFWGVPQRVGRPPINVLYVDTEGFEAAGKSNVYDDRVFALSALLSTVLVYNLPETLKEADIQKLQFAVELAEEFKGRAAAGVGGGAAVGERPPPFQLPSLLWLIQRDFLHGRTVSEMVKGALRTVPNPRSDPNVAHLNAIRASLSAAAGDYEAMGLAQPHLERTRLCSLADSELDPKYREQRAQLRETVQRMVGKAAAKKRLMTGPQFAAYLGTVVRALNAGEIPSVRSVTDTFNERIAAKALRAYTQQVEALSLPQPAARLLQTHERLLAECRRGYLRDKFGRGDKADLLDERVEKVYRWLRDRNVLASKESCERIYMKCTDLMDSLQLMSLPSLVRFDRVFSTRCNKTYEQGCVGPSKLNYRKRIEKDYAKERARFVGAYNQKLLNGITMASLLGVVIFRFIWVVPLFELAAWAVFLFLELYIKAQSLFFDKPSSPYWARFVQIWESVVFNEYYDLNSFVHVLVPLTVAAVVYKSSVRCYESLREYACFRCAQTAIGLAVCRCVPCASACRAILGRRARRSLLPYSLSDKES